MTPTASTIGGRRRAARVAAVQALYQMELSGGVPDDIIAEFVAYRLPETEDGGRKEPDIDLELFADLVRGTTARRADTDRVVGAALDKDRQFDRLEILMQSILRAGAYEILARTDIDAALTISEYVAVADAFFNEREPALVNAVLDRVARNLAGRASSADANHGLAQDG